MNYKYIVNKYCGRVYCGNGFFNTFEECMTFIRDEFCDRGKILDTETNEMINVKITEGK